VEYFNDAILDIKDEQLAGYGSYIVSERIGYIEK
jgi:recombinational DNA repair ATPase RecF